MTRPVEAVVVSIYWCPNRVTRWRVQRVHRRSKLQISQEVGAGIIDVIDGRYGDSAHLSVSLWSSMDAILGMKQSRTHVSLMHWARAQGISVDVLVYEVRGGWREALSIPG